MEIAYGLDIRSHEDKYLQAAERAMDHAQEAMVPGAFLVDTFPIRSSSPQSLGPYTLLTIYLEVKYVPEWFPGAGFKRFAKETRRLSELAVDGPLEYVKEALKVGSHGPRKPAPRYWTDCDDKSNRNNVSIASSCFDRVAGLRDQGFDESDIRAVTATAFVGEAPRSYGIEPPSLTGPCQLLQKP